MVNKDLHYDVISPLLLLMMIIMTLMLTSHKSNNNNNNYKIMFMVLSSWQRHCESSLGSSDECRTAPSGRLSSAADVPVVR